MTAKTFPKYTINGLGLSKTGKLMIPYKAKSEYADKGMNLYGQPLAKVGDLVCLSSHNGLITINNTGKVLKQEDLLRFGEVTYTGTEEAWTYTAYVMTAQEYEDVLGHYNKKG